MLRDKPGEVGADRRSYGVSLVVPTLNEAGSLGRVLSDIRGYGDEVFVMDGHSTDSTREVAAEQGVPCHLDGGRGKGEALRRALRIATQPIVLFIDADGSHVPADIPKLIAPIRNDEADLVIGSRMAGGSDELFSDFYEFIRLSGSMLINLAINYRWGVHLSDTQNGFRAILREMGLGLELKEDITSIEQEMVMQALNQGYRVMNVPSHEYRRLSGESKVIVSKVWHRYVFNVVKHVLSPSQRHLHKDL